MDHFIVAPDASRLRFVARSMVSAERLVRALRATVSEVVMRIRLAGGMLTVAVLFPSLGNAQVYSLPSSTRPPDVTAATAEWQINNRSILVQGLVFFPTSETRMFDSNVMIQTGVFEGVPVYSDATIEPFSLVYVPVGRATLRAYERRREGELAGTTGSRAPTFPVAPAASPVQTPERPVSTVGILAAPTPAVTAAATAPAPSRPAPTAVESVPRPRATDGVWIRFNGAKWYSSGEAVAYSPSRFTRIGDYRGFPVYRENKDKKDAIWVAIVQDGPLAPYSKR
jgi:hypothetical protein